MPHDNPFAFDRASVRRIDADGRMHVALTNISKANVCPYFGHEIPNWQALGLDPDRVYQLLRDPGELAKAVPTFNNIPLLSKHIPFSADDPPKEFVCGATGSEAQYEEPYLKNSLVIWDSSSIAGVNTNEQRELSASYRYRADMTPGVHEGVPYDGRMVDIIGNHVALVPVGRAGADVLVSDQLPQELHAMKLSDKAAVRAAVGAYLLPQLAQDSAIDDIKTLVSGITADTTLAKLAEDAAAAFPNAEIDAKALERSIRFALDESDDPALKPEGAEDEDDETEREKKDNESEAMRIKEREKREKEDKAEDRDQPKAMDAASIQKIRDDARNDAMKQFNALRRAEAEVRPLVGEIAAMDSAEDVYRYAMDQLGIPHKGVHPSAYPALIQMAGKRQEPEPRVALDSASNSDFMKRFPTAGNVQKV